MEPPPTLPGTQHRLPGLWQRSQEPIEPKGCGSRMGAIQERGWWGRGAGGGGTGLKSWTLIGWDRDERVTRIEYLDSDLSKQGWAGNGREGMGGQGWGGGELKEWSLIGQSRDEKDELN